MCGMSVELAWVRHAESESNAAESFGGHTQVALSALGHEQAEAVAISLAAWQPELIVTSDLQRAEQTAAAIALRSQAATRKDARLRERSLGVFDGQAFATVRDQHPADWRRLLAADASYCPPGGETLAQVSERVAAALDEWAGQATLRRIVIVSHGIALYHALLHVCGVAPGTPATFFSLVDNASVSRIARDARGWRIRTLNDTSHLAHLRRDASVLPPI